MRRLDFHIFKNKGSDQLWGNLLRLYSQFCVGPRRKSQRQVFSQLRLIYRHSFSTQKSMARSCKCSIWNENHCLMCIFLYLFSGKIGCWDRNSARLKTLLTGHWSRPRRSSLGNDMHTGWRTLPMLMAEFGDIGDWSLFIGPEVIKLVHAQLNLAWNLAFS